MLLKFVYLVDVLSNIKQHWGMKILKLQATLRIGPNPSWLEKSV